MSGVTQELAKLLFYEILCWLFRNFRHQLGDFIRDVAEELAHATEAVHADFPLVLKCQPAVLVIDGR
jgi:hypothetical protein